MAYYLPFQIHAPSLYSIINIHLLCPLLCLYFLEGNDNFTLSKIAINKIEISMWLGCN